MIKTVCIIGCGTYGSYLVSRLLASEKEKLKIIVVEVGGKKTKSESEIGISSKSKFSNAARDGRYFGLGGTSTRWGGQMLFFDKRDNINKEENWNQIVDINEKHKDRVLQHVLGYKVVYSKLKLECHHVKTGLWLAYNKRNLFKRFLQKSSECIEYVLHMRVVGFNYENNNIKSVRLKNIDGHEKDIEADIFYLTAGALESCRILMEFDKKYSVLNNTDLGTNMGDHLSIRLFDIANADPFIGGIDMTPRFYKGNMITKRLIVYTENKRMGYLHPIFNQDVKIFSQIKKLFFGRQEMSISFKDFLTGCLFLAKLGIDYIFKQKLHVETKKWSIQFDLEQCFPNNNFLSLSEEKDDFGERKLQINWNISESDITSISKVEQKVKALLSSDQIDFSHAFKGSIDAAKVEDVYHPVGFIRAGLDETAVVDFNGKVKNTCNLFHFSTAMFPSAKSINPSGAVFCHIEEHLSH